ncbi:MFS general substrate transporter [Dendrothele bispora CBS 962.96]|uniref:MFS general substrate transporter n=1 Tax=Dendrothele bispora (strain CBS 962.96) TaxID=1314807 RepID=A0A4S8LR78_DENBC|nr:MFS general substrate transporter [Dendrothele bispora CBS 962.96]
MPVADDPRKWSVIRKNFVLLQVCFGSMVAGLAGNIQNPAIEDMEADLPATSSQISLSISLFILFQGIVPLVWSAISEVKGRKAVYLTSLSIFTVASIVVAASKTIGLVIGFRCLQAAGSSAVMSIGAATLADIFDPQERGTKMGIYYIAPLIGPSAGALLGGALTTGFTWRGPFYFLAIVSGIVLLSFVLFFKDTFRRERSYVYQEILKKTLAEQVSSAKKFKASSEDVTRTPPAVSAAAIEIKVSLMDVNPLKPMATVITRRYNYLMLIASGLMFSFSFLVTYTTSRTLGTFYHYNPLLIGLVLVSFGVGNVTGSLLGGRWSDYQLKKLTQKNGGKSSPEMRLKSTIHGLIAFPFCIIGYAWIIQERLHIAGVCVMLFLCGFFAIFIYASTLAYLVDSNVGRSSTAVAINSAFRGTFAFIVTEIAVPMQDGLGDGWMYTIIAGLMVISGLLILLVMYKGTQWRAASDERHDTTSKDQIKDKDGYKK